MSILRRTLYIVQISKFLFLGITKVTVLDVNMFVSNNNYTVCKNSRELIQLYVLTSCKSIAVE